MPKRNRYTFAAELKMFRRNTMRGLTELHDEVVDAAHQSIVVGSPVTSSRGQPVRSGALRRSWVKETVGPLKTKIFTRSPYAPIVEFDAQPFVSSVGGPFALAKTMRYWQALVSSVAGRLKKAA